MTCFFNAIIGSRHPEERLTVASRRTHDHYAALLSQLREGPACAGTTWRGGDLICVAAFPYCSACHAAPKPLPDDPRRAVSPGGRLLVREELCRADRGAVRGVDGDQAGPRR